MLLRHCLVLVLVIILFNCGGDKLSKIETFPFDQPTQEELSKTAPDYFQIEFETSKGVFIVETTREWSPLGVDRFYHIARSGFFKDVRFYRVMDNFMAQFGAHGDPAVAQAWRNLNIQDDPVLQSNLRGYVTFATGGPNTRTTQLFINYRDNVGLDAQGFSPIGKVIQGMEIVDSLYKGYGDGPPRGKGPNQGLIAQQGNDYLKRDFPELDYIKDAKIIKVGK